MADESENKLFGGLRAAVAGVKSRYRVFIVAASLAAFSLVGWQLWNWARVEMRDDPRYRITVASIEVTPPPPWIRTDVRVEALRDAGLHGDLSVLDPPQELQQRLVDAFSFHPWVESVGAIAKRPPNRISIELTYRRPLAAVEVGGALAPVDAYGVRLPAADLTDAELRYLPRIQGVTSNSLPGEVWQDQRLRGAVSLVAALGDLWPRLHLVDVVPTRLEVSGDLRYYVYELVTVGGTRIEWGAAPAVSPRDESPFEAKLARLQGYVARNGPLNSTYQTPKVLKVRDVLDAEERSALLPAGEAGEAPAAIK